VDKKVYFSSPNQKKIRIFPVSFYCARDIKCSTRLKIILNKKKKKIGLKLIQKCDFVGALSDMFKIGMYLKKNNNNNNYKKVLRSRRKIATMTMRGSL